MNSARRQGQTPELAPRILKILIVEDNPEDAEIFAEFLTLDNGRRRECQTLPLGELAMKQLRDDPPDCVLLDYNLPDMTGLEWLAEARPSCPVVMLTGLGDELVAVAAMKAGAQDYLVKGRLGAEALRLAIDGAIERHALTLRLAEANARTAQVLDSVSDAYVVFDAAFRFQYVNRAAQILLRRDAGQLLDCSLWEVFPWLQGHEAGRRLTEARELGSQSQFEAHVSPNTARSNAAWVGWFEVRTFPTEGGGLTLYLRDVGAQKLAEARRLRSSERLERLHRAGVVLNAARGMSEVTAAVAAQAGAVFGALGGTLALQLGPEPVLHMTGTFGVSDEEVRAWTQLPLAAPFPLCEAVRSGRLVLLGNLEEATLWYPRLFDEGAAQGHAAWAAVPILRGLPGASQPGAGQPETSRPGSSQQALGSLGLIFGAPQAFEQDDQTLMLAYADLCAQALGRAQLYETERELRQSLERRVEARTAELRQSNSELEQFAAVASHDLREPLRTVSSYVQLLAARYGDQLDERGNKYLDFVQSGTTRMYRLIEDLLSLSRVGTHGSVFTLTDTHALLNSTLDMLGEAVSECGAVVSSQDMPQVMADATQLGQLFQNLIANALKFRQPGVSPLITVAAEQEGEFWRFTVRDNGLGIAPEYHQQVFTLFQRLHRRDEYQGNGIGLSVCQKIVVRHGGRIGLDSAAGQGSTFWFTLPALSSPPPPSPPPLQGGQAHD